jgi:hypothetical protein
VFSATPSAWRPVIASAFASGTVAMMFNASGVVGNIAAPGMTGYSALPLGLFDNLPQQDTQPGSVVFDHPSNYWNDATAPSPGRGISFSLHTPAGSHQIPELVNGKTGLRS